MPLPARSVFEMGSWSNPWIYAGIGALLALQLGFVYLPFMNTLFGSAPLDPLGWALSLLAALIMVPVVAAEKWWRNRQRRPGRHVGCSGPGPEATARR